MKSISTLNDIVSVLSDYAEIIGLIATLPTLKSTLNMLIKPKKGQTLSNSDLQQIIDTINNAKLEILEALNKNHQQIESIILQQHKSQPHDSNLSPLESIKQHIDLILNKKEIYATETSGYTAYKINNQNFLELHRSYTKINGTDHAYIKMHPTQTLGNITTASGIPVSNDKEVYAIPLHSLQNSITYLITMIENSLRTNWNR